MNLTVLTIDIGNTYTNFAVFKKEEMLFHSSIYTNLKSSTDEIHDFLDRALEKKSIHKIDKAVLSTVVPNLEHKWVEIFLRTSTPYMLANENSPWSFAIGISPPSQLGSDRMACAEAAIARFSAPVIIVDAGTATTFDLIIEKKDHLSYTGGVIAAGMNISYEALLKKASRLNAVPLYDSGDFPVLGKNTESALRSGIQHGFALMVDSMIEAICKEKQLENCKSIATGGNSIFLKNMSKKIDNFEPHLVLEGLRAISYK